MLFSYEAFDSSGRKVKGQVEEVDITAARRVLRLKGLSVSVLAEAIGQSSSRGRKFSNPFRAKVDLARFFGGLSVLMSAGLGIDQGLNALKASATTPHEREGIGRVLERLSSGAPPSHALVALGNIPADVLAVITSGERSARLGEMMRLVAEDMEKQRARRKQISDATVYPLFLLAMLLVAIIIVSFVLVPALEPVFESSGRPPPVMILLLSALREGLGSLPFQLSVFGTLTALLTMALARPQMLRRGFTALVLKTPFIGATIKNFALSRYLQSLGLLLSNSIPIPEALSLSAACCPVEKFQGRLGAMRDIVVSGRRLPDAIAASGLFPQSVVALVTIGDDVNRLSAVLQNASEILRSEAERNAGRLLALMTPAVTILLGIIIGGLAISVMTALLGVNALSMQ